MKPHSCKAFGALAIAFTLVGSAACSEDVVAPEQSKDNSIPGQEVGIRELKVSVPRLSRFDKVVDHFSCRIHLRGRRDHVDYPVNIFLSADKDSLYIEADDPILAELPHQLYHLNAITFAGKDMAARSDEEVREDTVYVGARLSLEDPDNIHFRSSFNVGANSIGSGTESDPWVIASGDDFMMRISDPMTRGETHEGKYFEITRNLNLNTSAVAYGKGWEPAGHNNVNGGSTDFNGTIDGCDNYIDNLYCYTDAGCGGLFYGLGEKAYIHNLEMRRVLLIGNSNIGAFACTSKKGCRLDSIEVNGSIEGKENIGGLIGSGDAWVKACISSVNITVPEGEASNIGGMIGNAQFATFKDCLRSGQIEAPTAEYVGGFVGKGGTGKYADADAEFERCYVSGSISGKTYVGGFAGYSNVDITNCHAGATLPQDSYAYTTQWDIFNLNNRMTPLPLLVESKGMYAGGFVGYSDRAFVNGENSFAYSSPAKPNITATSYAGALIGRGSIHCGTGTKVTSYAYVEAPEGYVGGLMGRGKVYGSPTLTNYGNVSGGGKDTGGVIGYVEGVAITINCTNTGNVRGQDYVGGIIGRCDEAITKSLMQNDGNVEATGDYVGGLFGSAGTTVNLLDGSRVSNENGSLKITGKSKVGGLCGYLRYYAGHAYNIGYCPVYANIISTGGSAGGLFGYVEIVVDRHNENMFASHHPVRVSIDVRGADNAGGAIGYLMNSSTKPPCISGFNDRLKASITTNGNIAGGIVGRIVNKKFDGPVVENCHSFTGITSTASGEVSGFGGIVGWFETDYANPLQITMCSNHGTLSGPHMTAIGGIAGYCETIDISKCYNAGRIDGVMSVGGIIGRLNDAGIIKDCFNMGEVPSASGREWLAGIIGQKEDRSSQIVEIQNCYNVGTTGWGIIGGEKNSIYDIDRCYYLGSASNGDMKNSGSQSKTADEMRRKSSYDSWSASTWEFHEGTAAPTLAGMPMFNHKLPLQK